MLTQAKVRELFDYDPFTGILRNKITRNARAMTGKEAGSINHYGYRETRIDSKLYRVHRVIWLWAFGKFPDKVDHIEGNRTDNRLHMLRDASALESTKNRCIPCTNSSGHIGVYWASTHNKWIANIGVNNKTIYLGIFKNKSDAVQARKEANIKYGFYKNHGRLKETI
jgi:hypothetical protein